MLADKVLNGDIFNGYWEISFWNTLERKNPKTFLFPRSIFARLSQYEPEESAKHTWLAWVYKQNKNFHWPLIFKLLIRISPRNRNNIWKSVRIIGPDGLVWQKRLWLKSRHTVQCVHWLPWCQILSQIRRAYPVKVRKSYAYWSSSRIQFHDPLQVQ